MENDKELILLQYIENTQSNCAQREASKAIGLSLGMTNALIKKLANKGWLLLSRINSRKVIYALTPEGLKEIAKRSLKFVKHSLSSLIDYKERLLNLAKEIQEAGYKGITVHDSSELDFLIEYAAQKQSLEFSLKENGPQWYLLKLEKIFSLKHIEGEKA